MAIIGTDQDDEQKNQAVQQPTTSTSPNAHAATEAAQGTPYGGASGGLVGGAGTGSGQGATTGVAATGAPTGAASPNPGGYTNLSQYLAVNQGGGGTVGQAATNVVQQSADAAKAAQGAYNTSAMGDIANATSAVAENPDTLGKIAGGQANVDQGTLDKINAGAFGYTPNQGALDNPRTAGKGDLDAIIKGGKDAAAWTYNGPSDFSKVGYGGPSIEQLTRDYGGPMTTSAFTGQTAANQNAAVAADATALGNAQNAQNGEKGVSALLKQAYQQPTYSQGENTLDTFLAGGTAGGQQALGQAQGIGQGVSNGYAGINTALADAIQHGQQTGNNTNAAYQKAINDATANSAATQAQYKAAVQAASQRGNVAAQAAKDAAAKAQAEENRRAVPNGQAPDSYITNTSQNVLDTAKKAGSDIANAGKIAGGQAADTTKTAVNGLTTLPATVGAAATGNQSAQNKVATDIATGGINVVAPKVVAPVAAKAQDLGSKVVNVVKNKGFPRFAKGGEVPSYSKILQTLKGKAR